MTLSNPHHGSALADGLAWLWVSLAVTGAPTARALLLPTDLGIAGRALDVFLTAVLFAAFVTIAASTALIFLSVQLPWAAPRIRGAGLAILGSFLPAVGALAFAAWVVPSYAATAGGCLLAILGGAAANAAFASVSARSRGRGARATTGPGRPGARG